jgi:hypothetical protein
MGRTLINVEVTEAQREALYASAERNGYISLSAMTREAWKALDGELVEVFESND